MIRRNRKAGTMPVTGDGRPLIRSQVAKAEASRSGRVVHVYADSVGGERLIWDVDVEQAERLLVCLQVCVANAKADGYAALAASQDDEDRGFHAAMRERRREVRDGGGAT